MASYGETSYGEVSYGEAAGLSSIFENVESNLTLTDAWTEEYTPWNEFVGDSIDFATALDLSAGIATAESILITNTLLLGKAWYYYHVSGMTFSDMTELSSAFAAKENIGLATNISHNVVGTTLVAENMTLADVGAVLFDALAADTVDFSDALAYSAAMNVVESLRLSGEVESHLAAIATTAEAIVLLADGGVVDFANTNETFELTTAVMARLMAYELYEAGISLADESSQTLFVYLENNEDIAFETDTQLSQQLITLIEEGVEFNATLRLGTDVYAAWVMNPVTKGTSRYDNFPFNSFAEGSDGYYGAADDGIYLLQGSDDDGTAIDVSIKSGLMDFGERRSKRINDVFLGVMTSGALVLKMTADEQGARTEAWYNVVNHGEADNHRAKVGKGLRGVYWGFELVNVDGADVDLDNLQLYPLTLTRRV